MAVGRSSSEIKPQVCSRTKKKSEKIKKTPSASPTPSANHLALLCLCCVAFMFVVGVIVWQIENYAFCLISTNDPQTVDGPRPLAHCNCGAEPALSPKVLHELVIGQSIYFVKIHFLCGQELRRKRNTMQQLLGSEGRVIVLNAYASKAKPGPLTQDANERRNEAPRCAAPDGAQCVAL